MTKPLDNRLALVTGASKGIGAATAQALAAAGAHVVLTGRDVRALEAVEDTIHAAGGASTIAPVDLAESDGIARLASAIASRWDKLDVLVAAAASPQADQADAVAAATAALRWERDMCADAAEEASTARTPSPAASPARTSVRPPASRPIRTSTGRYPPLS